MELDRRYEHRVPLEMYMNAYVADRAQRGFTVNVSEGGLFINTLPSSLVKPGTVVGLEFTLPGESETIWAAGEACRNLEDTYFHSRGIRFMAIAGLHVRMIRDYLQRVRKQRFYLGAPRVA